MIEQLVVKLNEQGKAEATKQAIRSMGYFSGDFWFENEKKNHLLEAIHGNSYHF